MYAVRRSGPAEADVRWQAGMHLRVRILDHRLPRARRRDVADAVRHRQRHPQSCPPRRTRCRPGAVPRSGPYCSRSPSVPVGTDRETRHAERARLGDVDEALVGVDARRRSANQRSSATISLRPSRMQNREAVAGGLRDRLHQVERAPCCSRPRAGRWRSHEREVRRRRLRPARLGREHLVPAGRRDRAAAPSRRGSRSRRGPPRSRQMPFGSPPTCPDPRSCDPSAAMRVQRTATVGRPDRAVARAHMTPSQRARSLPRRVTASGNPHVGASAVRIPAVDWCRRPGTTAPERGHDGGKDHDAPHHPDDPDPLGCSRLRDPRLAAAERACAKVAS